ncbi:PAS domain-containing sensor histidine kinase [Methanosalsum natronophilum]|uniref:PAS domain-containing sensor histidine kinase n=1 Tax=Methanosalsum natronophilum TaxID=768733 RepID=UPI0021692928|nr:PAS domain S-box protein [Methanosalsum natronophilum]MCS3923615.1 PAS domain S-box-containing protein [Methanosalsum natronophilum]
MSNENNEPVMTSNVDPYLKKKIDDMVSQGKFSSLSTILNLALSEFISNYEGEKEYRDLKESEHIYRILVEESSDIIYTLSPTGIFTYVSPQWTQLLGHETDEVIGHPFAEFVHTEDVPVCFEYLKEIADGKKSEPKPEYRVQHKDGNWYWHTSTGSAYYDDKKNVSYFIGIASDITETKMMHNRIKEENERFRILSTISNTGVWHYYPENEYLLCSPEYFSMLGYDINEFSHFTENNLNQTWINLIHPEDRAEASSKFQEFIDGGMVGIYENYFRMKHKNGSTVWVWSRGSAIDNVANIDNNNNDLNENKIVLGTHIDVTAQKEYEKRLQKRENKYRSLVEQSVEMLYLHDMSGNFIEVNRASVENTGYSKDELLQMNVMDIDANFSFEEVVSMWNTWEYGKLQTFTSTHRTASGNTFPVEINVRKIKIDNEPYMMVLARDITEQIKSIEFENKVRELEKKHLIVQEVHHRVKNNLQVINSLLNMQARSFDDERVLNAFKDSQTRIRSMSIAHEQLYGAQDLASVEISKYIHDIVNSVLRHYNNEEKDIELNLDSDEIYLNMDYTIPLGLIINEIVTNSFKHAFTGRDDCKLTVKFKTINDNYQLIVRDNGPGIPANLDIETLDSLGFKIIDLLVTQLSGKIDIDTSHGTCYKILIPT